MLIYLEKLITTLLEHKNCNTPIPCEITSICMQMLAQGD